MGKQQDLFPKRCGACEWDLEEANGVNYAPRLDHTCGKEWPQYLNVYELHQCYGGPEEGGWWFDAGEPLESVMVCDQREKNEALVKLHKRYELNEAGEYLPENPEDPEVDRVRGRTSAAGGYDICIESEASFAQPWPIYRPRYE